MKASFIPKLIEIQQNVEYGWHVRLGIQATTHKPEGASPQEAQKIKRIRSGVAKSLRNQELRS